MKSKIEELLRKSIDDARVSLHLRKICVHRVQAILDTLSIFSELDAKYVKEIVESVQHFVEALDSGDSVAEDIEGFLQYEFNNLSRDYIGF